MHSSGMRTAHLLTVSQHELWQGGVPARGMYLPGGCICPGGCTCPEKGVPAQVLSPLVDRQTPVKT